MCVCVCVCSSQSCNEGLVMLEWASPQFAE